MLVKPEESYYLHPPLYDLDYIYECRTLKLHVYAKDDQQAQECLTYTLFHSIIVQLNIMNV